MAGSLRNTILINAAGFGLAGALWGAARFFLVEPSETVIDFPLHYIMIFSISILGGLSLTYGSRDWKWIGRVIGFGFLGGLVGIIFATFSIFQLRFLGRALIAPILNSESTFFFWNDFSKLDPNIVVADLWVMFLAVGTIIGAFFAFGMKEKIWPMAWRAGVGMAIGSIVGPIIGNLIGGPLWLAYLITFTIIAASMGAAMVWKYRPKQSHAREE